MALWGLEKLELFNGLNPGELQLIGKIINKVMYSKGDVIAEKGNKSRDVFVLLEGRVDIVSLNGIPLYRISKGESFGELALVPNLKRTAVAVAREDSWVLIININHLESFSLENHEIFSKVYTNLVTSLGVKLARANKLIELLKGELAKSIKE
jgi:CRP-like cAMP-binding protein